MTAHCTTCTCFPPGEAFAPRPATSTRAARAAKKTVADALEAVREARKKP